MAGQAQDVLAGVIDGQGRMEVTMGWRDKFIYAMFSCGEQNKLDTVNEYVTEDHP